MPTAHNLADLLDFSHTQLEAPAFAVPGLTLAPDLPGAPVGPEPLGGPAPPGPECRIPHRLNQSRASHHRGHFWTLDVHGVPPQLTVVMLPRL